MRRHTQKRIQALGMIIELASDPPAPRLAQVAWLGDSREVLRAFPAGAQQDLGYALYQVPLGQVPPDSKPMKTVGPGVYELGNRTSVHRIGSFYLKKIANVVYVLHCFEKRTGQTAEKDIQVAREKA